MVSGCTSAILNISRSSASGKQGGPAYEYMAPHEETEGEWWKEGKRKEGLARLVLVSHSTQLGLSSGSLPISSTHVQFVLCLQYPFACMASFLSLIL